MSARPAYPQPALQSVLQPAKNALDLGLIVRDLGASLKFYQEILGLEKAGEFQMPFGPMVRLRFGESDLKLILPKEPPPAGPAGVEHQLGYRYVTFVVKDLDGLSHYLQSRQVEFAITPTEIAPGARIAMVKDPDGNLVEFVERH